MNIILIGFMGSGKTVVGQLLAKELGLDFLDTDELIEKSEGRKISEIFRVEGEEHFRDLETEVLKTLQDYDNFVLSTGGGMVLRQANVDIFKTIGPVILLWAAPETIFARVQKETHRPLLQVADPLAEIKKRLELRLPFYNAAADWQVDTGQKDPGTIAKEIIIWLRSK